MKARREYSQKLRFKSRKKGDARAPERGRKEEGEKRGRKEDEEAQAGPQDETAPTGGEKREPGEWTREPNAGPVRTEQTSRRFELPMKADKISTQTVKRTTEEAPEGPRDERMAEYLMKREKQRQFRENLERQICEREKFRIQKHLKTQKKLKIGTENKKKTGTEKVKLGNNEEDLKTTSIPRTEHEKNIQKEPENESMRKELLEKVMKEVKVRAMERKSPVKAEEERGEVDIDKLKSMIHEILKEEMRNKVKGSPPRGHETPKNRNGVISASKRSHRESSKTMKRVSLPRIARNDVETKPSMEKKERSATKRTQPIFSSKSSGKMTSFSLQQTFKTLPVPFSHLKSKDSADLFQFKNNISEISVSKFGPEAPKESNSKGQIGKAETENSAKKDPKRRLRETKGGPLMKKKNEIPSLEMIEFKEMLSQSNGSSVRLETFTDFIEMSEDELEDQSVKFSKAIPY